MKKNEVESVLVERNFYTLINLLPTRKRLAMYEAIMEYAFFKTEPELKSEEEKVLWKTFKVSIDKSVYAEFRRKKRSEERRKTKPEKMAETPKKVAFNYPSYVEVDVSVSDTEFLKRLFAKVNTNSYLKEWKFLSKYIRKAEKILSGYYDKYMTAQDRKTEEYMTHNYSEEKLRSAIVNFEKWGENDSDNN